MVAKIITLANQKGGSGKTNTTMQLAGALGRKKKKVLVVDADPQGTSVRWASVAPEDSPFPAAVMSLSAAGGKVHQEVSKFVDDYDFIIIDCPPAVESDVTQSALMISDLVVVPVLPSPSDLWAAVGIVELISRVEVLNKDLKKLIVVNSCQPNIVLGQEVIAALNDFKMPVAKTKVSLRNAYRKSSAYGQTVHFLGNAEKKAINEIESLTKEVVNIVNK